MDSDDEKDLVVLQKNFVFKQVVTGVCDLDKQLQGSTSPNSKLEIFRFRPILFLSENSN